MPKAMSPMECIAKHALIGDGCWLWEGKILRPGMGYGLASQHAKWELAHRMSYKTFIGPIPDGMMVLHRCDVPSCVKPEHLYLGTQRENMHDMESKGRRRKDVRDGKGRFAAYV